jgi:hypothetical protein
MEKGKILFQMVINLEEHIKKINVMEKELIDLQMATY